MAAFASATAAVVLSLAAFGAPAALAALGGDLPRGEIRSLTLHNLHNGEDATIVFKRDGVYDQDGLRQLDYILRDVRQDTVYDMDPHLFDLIWEVYQETGASKPIQIVCGYRTPGTNEYLRKTSDGVAENSLHMRGQALDFYIPDVDLAKLRAVGLRMQSGGVGFYPESGSPFVHIDTGSVRHWPLMSRQQLLAVFPDGKTLDIPADGKPLPGYSEALAAYKARQAELTPVTEVASFSSTGQQQKPNLFGKIVQTVTGRETAVAALPAITAPARQPVAVAVAATGSLTAPKPNLAPRAPQPTVVVASLLTLPRSAPAVLPAKPRISSPRVADFASPDFWTAPTVPTALAAAMAARGQHEAGSSLPIAPTAVVATVSVSRALAADAITTAVIRSDAPTAATISAFLAYAPDVPATRAATPAVNKPQAAAVAAPVAARPQQPAVVTPPPPLTLTALDTQGLRLWMRASSTRQRTYALLTMPDFAPTAALMSAAAVTSAFGPAPMGTLKTDRFAPVETR